MRKTIGAVITVTLLLSLPMMGCNSGGNGSSSAISSEVSEGANATDESQDSNNQVESGGDDERAAVYTYMMQAFKVNDQLGNVFGDADVVNCIVNGDADSIVATKQTFDEELTILKSMDVPEECKVLHEQMTEAGLLTDKFLEKSIEAAETTDLNEADVKMRDANTYVKEITPYFSSIAQEMNRISNEWTVYS